MSSIKRFVCYYSITLFIRALRDLTIILGYTYVCINNVTILMYFNLFFYCHFVIYVPWSMHLKRTRWCKSGKKGRWIKSSEGFLVFVIHDNYLLQCFYTDIWCLLHLKFNILVIFTKYSIRAVSNWSTCQCLCWRTIRICFCLRNTFCQILGESKLILLYQRSIYKFLLGISVTV